MINLKFQVNETSVPTDFTDNLARLLKIVYNYKEMRRLVQKNIKHTGYAILTDNLGNEKILPTFSKDLIWESMELETSSFKLTGIYGARSIMPTIMELIKEFKEKYGIVPQNHTTELRTGFQNSIDLYQSDKRFCYK